MKYLLILLIALTGVEGLFQFKINRFPGETRLFEKSLYQFSSNATLIYELIPDNNVVFDQVEYSTNQWGYRDKDWRQNKTKNRIAIIGDSMIFPYGLNMEDGVVSQLQKTISPAYEIISLSVPRYNASQLAVLVLESHEKFNPDFFIVMVNRGDADSTNGLYSFNRFNYPGSLTSYLPGSWQWLLARIAGSVDQEQEGDDANLDMLLENLHKTAVPCLVVYLPYCGHKNSHFYDSLPEKFRVRNIEVTRLNTNEECLDGLHYSATGHKILFQALGPVVNRFLKDHHLCNQYSL